MSRENITENVKRRLYTESMGRCMNPNCQRELLQGSGDIIEKAHIIPYCKTSDNSFENLIVLCPNCHKSFDKSSSFSTEQVKSWKKLRKDELDKLFTKKFATFDDLRKEVAPLLSENTIIYQNYYLSNKKELWNKFEVKILINNRKLRALFEQNLNLFQRHSEESYSNLNSINSFIAHTREFEDTRLDTEKERQILFPIEINSMFGITPVTDSLLPSTESLETLIAKLIELNKFKNLVIGTEAPYIQLNEDGKNSIVYLTDIPRLRQLYFDHNCFRRTKVRLDSLNFAFKYMHSRNIQFEFLYSNSLREVSVNGIKIRFIYEYCLSKVELMQLSPEENSVIVNLHNWNGDSCISNEAYVLSKKIKVTLLTMEDFYVYINGIKSKE
ncbi:HNH endonuclease signature motif containing protein [Listeria monocytogenes]|uniref:HNH endonuclease signature motif containing protein n=1 Tax=Listeria monocytogenes TaxID=1639 RepID=UPI000D6F68F7|nr:HNH endonuclease signature motif containing protein [Listeria monocytogenes]EAG9320512.1 HNH endonuclease [Listeria monocytogenes]PWR39781.1 HNH endonuclease [Listeria monocytogenes]